MGKFGKQSTELGWAKEEEKDMKCTQHYKKYRFWQRQMSLAKTQSCCKKCFSQQKNCCCMSLA
jgi:hypothetical protein